MKNDGVRKKNNLFRGSLCVVVVRWRRRSFSSERTDFMILPGFPISSTSCVREKKTPRTKMQTSPFQRERNKNRNPKSLFSATTLVTGPLQTWMC